MGSRLQHEIKQTRPFESPEVEVWLNLHRTHDRLSGLIRARLKADGVSVPQYNALRILRGAGPDGLPSLEVAARMVTRVPDITRLLERLHTAGLVVRAQSKEDRRVRRCTITEDGLAILARLDQPLVDLHQDMLGHLNAEELATLNDLLVKARERAEPGVAPDASA